MEFGAKLQEVLTTYFYSTDIPLSVVNEIGKEILSTGKVSGFCEFFRESTDELCPCSQTHLYASKQAVTIGDVYIFSCPAGLVHFTVPLMIGDSFKGAVLAGPVLLEFPDVLMVDEILQKFNLPVSFRGKMNSYLKAIPVIEPTKLRHLSNLLFIVVLSLMGEEKNILNERNKRSVHQSLLSESIQDFKNESIEPFYPFEVEKELLLKVKNGDIIGAKNVLNDLLAHMLFSSGGNIEIIKSRTLELCTLLSRASMEGAADFNKLFGLNYNFFREINKINNIEDLTYWLVNILDKFTENVFHVVDSKNAIVIQRAISFINENYKDNLTLSTVANLVHLNASYFSSFFKKETSMSFSSYLNKVRIEKSKLLLKNYDETILNIALEVGFEDQSYFTKVFKALTTMTPKEYQHKLL